MRTETSLNLPRTQFIFLFYINLHSTSFSFLVIVISADFTVLFNFKKNAALLLLSHRDLLHCPSPEQLVFPDTVPALWGLPGYPLAIYAQTGT